LKDVSTTSISVSPANFRYNQAIAGDVVGVVPQPMVRRVVRGLGLDEITRFQRLHDIDNILERIADLLGIAAALLVISSVSTSANLAWIALRSWCGVRFTGILNTP
jgi:hypothetical protein